MRIHRKKKTIQTPIQGRAKDSGGSTSVTAFFLIVLIAAGLVYVYTTRPQIFAPLTDFQLGKSQTTGQAPAR